MTILVGGCNEKFRSDEQKGSCRFQDLVPQKPGPETGHGALVGILRQDGVAAVLPRLIDELEYDLRLCDGFITLIDEDRNFSWMIEQGTSSYRPWHELLRSRTSAGGGPTDLQQI